MLRFLGIAAALLEQTAPTASLGRRVSVIEEIENGLHPSQARRRVELARNEVGPRGIRLVATTHNPAVLSALAADDHAGGRVCGRNPETGESRIRRLVDLSGYPRAIARGELGDALTEGTLFEVPDLEKRQAALEAFLEKL